MPRSPCLSLDIDNVLLKDTPFAGLPITQKQSLDKAHFHGYKENDSFLRIILLSVELV